MRKPLILLLGVAVLGLLAAPALATVLRRLDPPALAREASLVVRGVVRKATVSREPGGIFTHTFVEVQEAWKGAGGATVIVRQPGGTLGDRTLLVLGQPKLAPGEEVVLFLTGEGHYRFLVGMAQGSFRVLRAPGAAPRAVSDVSGASLARPDGTLEPGGRRVLELEALRAVVRSGGGR